MSTPAVELDGADVGELLAGQTEILERIATGAALPEVLTLIAATLERLLPNSSCSVLLLDRDTAVLRHGAAPSLPVEYLAGIDGMSIGAGAGSCGTAAYCGEVVVATDVRTDVRWRDFRELAARSGLRACWSTPIRGRDGICGTFAVYHRVPHRPTAREEYLAGRLTHLASLAIDHDAVRGALAESEERFRRAFEDNAGGMALTTPDGAVTRVNRAMQTMFGRSEADLVGAPLGALFVPRHAGDAVSCDEAYEATAHDAGGHPLDVVVTVSPIRSTVGVAQALSVNVLDVTGRRAAERERSRRVEAESARAAAESADRAKSDFVAALGHELRTPLQAITGFTELIGTMELEPARRREALDHIGAAVCHILTMVDDVLDVARIDARALPLVLHVVDLGAVVDEVVVMVGPLAAAERVTVHQQGPPRAVRVRADERRVRQVLLNLVTNAIRYNRADGTVRVDLTEADGTVTVTVRDTGNGIAPEHVGRLFTPFDRLGRDCDEGIGLGLPLARGLTEAMGGTITVSSEVGAGTAVAMVLPAAPDLS